MELKIDWSANSLTKHLQKRSNQVNACVLRASKRCSLRRHKHHLREALRRFNRLKHKLDLVPWECLTAPVPSHNEPSYE